MKARCRPAPSKWWASTCSRPGTLTREGKLTSVVAKDEARNIYRKLVSGGSAVVGAILLGDIRGSGEIAEAIRTRKDMATLKNELAGKGLEF